MKSVWEKTQRQTWRQEKWQQLLRKVRTMWHEAKVHGRQQSTGWGLGHSREEGTKQTMELLLRLTQGREAASS